MALYGDVLDPETDAHWSIYLKSSDEAEGTRWNFNFSPPPNNQDKLLLDSVKTRPDTHQTMGYVVIKKWNDEQKAKANAKILAMKSGSLDVKTPLQEIFKKYPIPGSTKDAASSEFYKNFDWSKPQYMCRLGPLVLLKELESEGLVPSGTYEAWFALASKWNNEIAKEFISKGSFKWENTIAGRYYGAEGPNAESTKAKAVEDQEAANAAKHGKGNSPGVDKRTLSHYGTKATTVLSILERGLRSRVL